MTHKNHENYDPASIELINQLKKLEIEMSDSLLMIVKELDVTESDEMISLRESFAKNINPDDETTKKLADQYFRLSQEMTKDDKRPEAILAANILLVVFNLPRQNQSIVSDFTEAFYNAVEIAEMIDSPITNRSLDVLNKIS
ncbi:MAG: hypothetical protein OEX81_02840 [Candidatus Pacebacteria bacterium]|nr:hypothetical protein [Candidatus Paceibacterota bacterium]